MAADLLPAQGRQSCLRLQGSRVVQAQLSAAGEEWLVTCASMGNPHAVIYSTADGASIRVLRTAMPCCEPRQCQAYTAAMVKAVTSLNQLSLLS